MTRGEIMSDTELRLQER